jgi:hypothetical protein
MSLARRQNSRLSHRLRGIQLKNYKVSVNAKVVNRNADMRRAKKQLVTAIDIYNECGTQCVTSHEIKEANAMSDAAMLDKTFEIIMRRMVETGQAPHYTEIAKELGLSIEAGRQAVHKLFKAGVPGWLFPNTSLITSLLLQQLPTQYRITIDGDSLVGSEDLSRWRSAGSFQENGACRLSMSDCGLPSAFKFAWSLAQAEPKGLDCLCVGSLLEVV